MGNIKQKNESENAGQLGVNCLRLKLTLKRLKVTFSNSKNETEITKSTLATKLKVNWKQKKFKIK